MTSTDKKSDDTRPRYHHGALKEALVAAGIAELEASGIESFSLRKVAKRAGVSHAAPAHHFGDANGLLTAMAARGFEMFVDAMRDHPDATDDPSVTSVLGYVAFAAKTPAVFRLIFSSTRPNYDNPSLKSASDTAFDHLASLIETRRGVSPFADPAAMLDAMALWAMAHGLADLLSSHRLKPLQAMPSDERRRILIALAERVLPPLGSAPVDHSTQ